MTERLLLCSCSVKYRNHVMNEGKKHASAILVWHVSECLGITFDTLVSDYGDAAVPLPFTI